MSKVVKKILFCQIVFFIDYQCFNFVLKSLFV